MFNKGDRVLALGHSGTMVGGPVRIHSRHKRGGFVVDLDCGRRVTVTLSELAPVNSSLKSAAKGVAKGFLVGAVLLLALKGLTGCSSLKEPTTPAEAKAYCAAIDQSRADAAKLADDDFMYAGLNAQLDEMAEGHCP